MQDPEYSKRMDEINDTLDRLIKVAKKKGYLDSEATIDVLKETARAQVAAERAATEEKSATGLMESMKQRLDSQTAAVCARMGMKFTIMREFRYFCAM